MVDVKERRVMVVDDDSHFVHLVSQQLRELTGLPVDGFTNPLEALQHARVTPLWLVISDFRMPDMDGVVFLQEVAKLQPHCRRVALSGNSDTDALVRLVNDAAIHRYLPKPVDMQDMRNLVQEALQSGAAASPVAGAVPQRAGTMPRPTPTTLRTTPLLAMLPETRLRELAQVADWNVYKAGQSIMSQNEPSEGVLFVIAGYVKVLRGGTHSLTTQTKSGEDRRVRRRHQVMVALMGPGDMAGEVATLLETGRSASIVALTPSQVLRLPGSAFLATMQQHPDFALEVARKLARRLIGADQQMELLRGDLEGRIHALIRHCHAIGLDTKRWLNNAEIARMVGATRVAVSPIMGRINRELAATAGQ